MPPCCLFLWVDHSGLTESLIEPLLCSEELKVHIQIKNYSVGCLMSSSNADKREVKLPLLCPVHVLACYVECTAPIRYTVQFVICFRDGMAGKALSTLPQPPLRLPVGYVISQAYRLAGCDPVVRAHLIHALFSGVCTTTCPMFPGRHEEEGLRVVDCVLTPGVIAMAT